MANRLSIAVPTSPLVNPATGVINPEWRAFFVALQLRTGGMLGADTSIAELEAELDKEREERIAADLHIGVTLDNEAALRAQADARLQSAITAEANTRMLQDGLLVPRALLGQLWAQQDLATWLPGADPGHGMPWLDPVNATVMVGAPMMVVGLEGGGDWLLEGGGAWIWG